jgi:hypothetical protein
MSIGYGPYGHAEKAKKQKEKVGKDLQLPIIGFAQKKKKKRRRQ